MDWELVDSTGTKLFNTCLGCGEPGVVTLTQGGLNAIGSNSTINGMDSGSSVKVGTASLPLVIRPGGGITGYFLLAEPAQRYLRPRLA